MLGKILSKSSKTIGSLSVLTSSLLFLSTGISQVAVAQSDSTNFSNASLQGNYIYINSSSEVASFGPLNFDGNGNVTAALRVSLPCANPAPNCSRNVTETTGQGTYAVEPDGTGTATLNLSSGTIVYSFVITRSAEVDGSRLATEVFAMGETGGLAGQLVAPTWTRR